MRRIRRRFDKSTASFFAAFYFIVKFAGFFILLFTPLMIAQGIRLGERVSDGDESIDFGTVCSVVPCFILYSKMDGTVQSLYSWTLLLFLLTGIIGFARKYTVFAAQRVREGYFGDKAYRNSGLFFNSWSWYNDSR